MTASEPASQGTTAPGHLGGSDRPKRPSLHDVAWFAGVSHQTVSRVVNNSPNVSEETRKRVLTAIDVLGYRRNVAARALATSRTHTVGLLVGGDTRFGPSSTLLAVAKAARESGLYVSLAVIQGSSADATKEALDHFREQAVEGIVVVAPVMGVVEVVRAEASPSIPTVVVAAGEEPRPGFRVAAVDQQLGARLATRHLLELGHADVAHVAGPLAWHDAAERIRGWQEERTHWGLPPRKPILADWSSSTGYEVGRRLLAKAATKRKSARLPTAIFAANDQLSLGLLRAFSEAGIDVPGRISVVGFDDIEGADYFTPPLTTVRQPFAELGQTCIDLLVEGSRSGSAGSGALVQVPPTLVVRATTAPPEPTKAR